MKYFLENDCLSENFFFYNYDNFFQGLFREKEKLEKIFMSVNVNYVFF